MHPLNHFNTSPRRNQFNKWPILEFHLAFTKLVGLNAPSLITLNVNKVIIVPLWLQWHNENRIRLEPTPTVFGENKSEYSCFRSRRIAKTIFIHCAGIHHCVQECSFISSWPPFITGLRWVQLMFRFLHYFTPLVLKYRWLDLNVWRCWWVNIWCSMIPEDLQQQLLSMKKHGSWEVTPHNGSPPTMYAINTLFLFL